MNSQSSLPKSLSQNLYWLHYKEYHAKTEISGTQRTKEIQNYVTKASTCMIKNTGQYQSYGQIKNLLPTQEHHCACSATALFPKYTGCISGPLTYICTWRLRVNNWEEFCHRNSTSHSYTVHTTFSSLISKVSQTNPWGRVYGSLLSSSIGLSSSMHPHSLTSSSTYKTGKCASHLNL